MRSSRGILVKSQPEISQEQLNCIKALYDGVVRFLRKSPTTKTRRVTPRTRRSSEFVVPTTPADHKIPLLHLKRKSAGTRECSSNLTSVYLGSPQRNCDLWHHLQRQECASQWCWKVGKNVKGSLSSGDAHVVFAASRYSRKTVEYYQGISQTHSSPGSTLTVVPFNQGSKQDVDALVDYIYSTLNLNLDYVLPSPPFPKKSSKLMVTTTNRNLRTVSCLSIRFACLMP